MNNKLLTALTSCVLIMGLAACSTNKVASTSNDSKVEEKVKQEEQRRQEAEAQRQAEEEKAKQEQQRQKQEQVHKQQDVQVQKQRKVTQKKTEKEAREEQESLEYAKKKAQSFEDKEREKMSCDEATNVLEQLKNGEQNPATKEHIIKYQEKVNMCSK
ncbi:hypothetical protein [Bacillus anthracis]|uniref:hypothetical protein n=1 Tax=Bacillus cereus group TaxID=86661 RepID=UPI002DB7BC7F|nr:hypothetical protein [Bacillus anthracis]MEB9908216.1 hypothetical protein [Bacillus anthracis]MEC1956973.1 hypothetical protein [Bacillus anthracis]